jgi:hypothetical protein
MNMVESRSKCSMRLTSSSNLSNSGNQPGGDAINMRTVKRSVAAYEAHRTRNKEALDRVTAEPLRTWLRETAEPLRKRLQDSIDWYTAAIEARYGGRALPPKPQPPTRKPAFCVYRHFNAHGALLYIGETDDWQRRTKDHRHTAPFSMRS